MKTKQIQSSLNEFTGRHLVLIDKTAKKASINSYSKKVGINFISSNELSEQVGVSQVLGDSDGIIFEELGIGIVNDMPEEISMLMSSNGSSPFYYSEPETYVYAISEVDYVKGFKDAVNILYDALLEENRIPSQETKPVIETDQKSTWGLLKTNVPNSSFNGRNVNVAVLDTGFYGIHPDFEGRRIIGKSFVNGENWDEDRNGHGTHCIGISCGSFKIEEGIRYGIAGESNIYVGKVLSNKGSGTSGGVIEGIYWAIKNKCRVISMSLGSRVSIGQKPSPVYEKAGREALNYGAIIIAAAGNESRRPGFVNPIGSPANCKSIMAVAAIDKNTKLGSFSNGGLNLDGGKVDIAAPGVDVLSSWTALDNSQLYKRISGTSMATPHVAGIAALLCEAYPNATPEQIWMMLIQNAKGIGLPVEDVGAGLAQAI